MGADGIHSLVRRVAVGPERPRFTGCAAYRGLVAADRLRHLGLEVTAQVWMGPGRHFVHYFVASRALVNFVAIVEQDTWTRESWTDRGEIADALAAFDGWHPHVRDIIGAVDETFIWALFDRAPLARWSAGRVTLLGDACHAMLPFMAQGAAQAIEDGATLAACLAEPGPDVAAALRRYEELRLPRAGAHPGHVDRQQDAASTCPTARSSSGATRRWQRERPTGRSRPSRGSTSTTPPTSPGHRPARESTRSGSREGGPPPGARPSRDPVALVRHKS